MAVFDGMEILAFGGVTAFGALVCYLAARFGWLASWPWATGVLRLLAMWLIAAWVGYGTPLYVAVAILPLAVIWMKQQHSILRLLVLEFGFGLFMVWHSQMPLLVLNLGLLVLVDQVLARFSLLRFDKQKEPRENIYRFLLVAGFAGFAVLGTYFQGATISKYVVTHSLRTSLDLIPMGGVRFWYKSHTLNHKDLPSGALPSVFWQSRAPVSTKQCLLSLHGAAVEGSLQGAAQVIGRGAIRAGFRVYALDHPGFGASPAPRYGDNIDVWNPGLHTERLLQVMRREGCEEISVLGHSQGVTEALRLVVSGTDLAGGWVLGAGLYLDDPEREDYWFQRFHHDRGLDSSNSQLDKVNWKLIRDLFYINQDYCADSPIGSVYSGKTPLHYLTFKNEHENLAATREQLWECLDYPDKTRAEVNTDHYLDSLRLGGSSRIGQLVLLPRRSSAAIATLLAASNIVPAAETVDTTQSP